MGKKWEKSSDLFQENKRKRKESCIYGNYPHYYSYRIDQSLVEDPRLAVLRKEWFEDKDCLDIGCNQGLITLSVAKKFSCRSILGVDIDKDLIETAKWNLRKLARTELANSKSRQDAESKMSNLESPLKSQPCQTPCQQTANSLRDGSQSKETNFFRRISFKAENFIDDFESCSEKYDTILCLSLTKWIHLNWGDDGLISLFAKIWMLLRPGGMLILEPQPWLSYRNKRKVSMIARENFNNILLDPDLFTEILLDKIGFRWIETLAEDLPGSISGFNRPIVAFRK